MLTAVLVRRLKILKLLPELVDIGFQLRSLSCQPLVDFRSRAEDEPANEVLTHWSRDHGVS